MRERLPDIKIKPDVTPSEFLTKLRNLAAQPDVWRIGQFNEEANGRELVMRLDYMGAKKGIPDTLAAWFLYDAEHDKNRVRVEMTSRDWDATYDKYVDAAHLLKPFLRLYNRTHGAKVRLNVESREQLVVYHSLCDG